MCITARAGAGREAARTSPPEHMALSPAGPDSPVSPGKELTHAVRKQQRALEERLEACLEELRRLCLREAVRAARLRGGAESQGSGAAHHRSPWGGRQYRTGEEPRAPWPGPCRGPARAEAWPRGAGGTALDAGRAEVAGAGWAWAMHACWTVLRPGLGL